MRRPPSAWLDTDAADIERYPETLFLSQGADASARLNPRTNKRGTVSHFDWQPVVTQRDGQSMPSFLFQARSGIDSAAPPDLRIRPHPLYPPVQLLPTRKVFNRALGVSEEVCDVARSDKDLLEAASSRSLQRERFHPTILLNAILHAQNATSNRTNPTQSRPGNTLCISSSSATGTSNAVWISNTPASTDVPSSSVVACGEFLPAPRPTTAGSDSTFPPNFQPFPLFSPSPHPVISSECPVLSLQLAPLPARSTSLLAVRTLTSLKILQVNLHPSTMRFAKKKTRAENVLASFDYVGRELGRRPLADVALAGAGSGELGSGLVADVDGALWGWGLGTSGVGKVGHPDWKGARPEMFRLRRGRRGLGYDGGVNVAYGGLRGLDAVVAMDDEVLLYDLRSPTASSTLVDIGMLSRGIPYGLDQSPSIVTSLAVPSPATPLCSVDAPAVTPTSIHAVCTTRDIIWLDARMPGKDIMRWAHGRTGRSSRGYDTSLSLMHLGGDVDNEAGDSIDRVVLHSRLHPELSVYTYSTNATQPPHSLLDPYTLSSPSPSPLWSRTGLAITPANSDLGGDIGVTERSWLVMESGADGSLFGRYNTLKAHDPSSRELDVRYRRKEIIVGAGDLSDDLTVEVDESSARQVRQLGMTADRVFGDARGFDGGRDRKCAIEHLLQKAGVALAKRALANEDGDPGVLTLSVSFQIATQLKSHRLRDSYDLLAMPFKSLDEESHLDDEQSASTLPSLPRPSTFLRQSGPALDSLNGAAKCINAVTEALTDPVEWSSLLLRDEPRTSGDVQESIRPNPTIKWSHMTREAQVLTQRYAVNAPDLEGLAAEACTRVVFDTAVASRLFSLRPIVLDPPAQYSNVPFPPHVDPPSVHFSYFRPRSDEPEPDEESDDTWKHKSLKSTGVRLLLGEWNVGVNPETYAWANPYRLEKKQVGAQDEEEELLSSQAARGGKRKRQSQEPAYSSQPHSSQAFTPKEPKQRGPESRWIHTIQEEPSSDPGREIAASQPTGNGASSSFQNAWQGAASQVLPGAFGGRGPDGEASKKKPRAKKRVSGF